MNDPILPPIAPSAASIDLTAHHITLPVQSGEVIITLTVDLKPLPSEIQKLENTIALTGQIKSLDQFIVPDTVQKISATDTNNVEQNIKITTPHGDIKAVIPPQSLSSRTFPPPSIGQTVQLTIQHNDVETGKLSYVIPRTQLTGYEVPHRITPPPPVRGTDTPVDVSLSTSAQPTLPEQTLNNTPEAQSSPYGKIVHLTPIHGPTYAKQADSPVPPQARTNTHHSTTQISKGTTEQTNTPPSTNAPHLHADSTKPVQDQHPSPTPNTTETPASPGSKPAESSTLNTASMRPYEPPPPPARHASSYRSIETVMTARLDLAPPSPQTPGTLRQNTSEPLTDSQPIRARLQGQSEHGRPVLQTFSADGRPGQRFIVHIPQNSIPIGTELYLTPHESLLLDPSPTAQTVSDLLTPVSYWAVMGDIAQFLHNVAPHLAQIMTALTPQPNNPTQMTAAAMLFIAATTGGDSAAWFGDRIIEALKQFGGKDLQARMNHEGSLIGRGFETMSGDWRGTAFPLFWNNEFHRATLHYRYDEPEKNSPNHNGKQTRFIFDLSVPRMGYIQLDGLHDASRLDIILRTEAPFNETMQADMRRAFSAALSETPLTGSLSFQTDPNTWVTIAPAKKHFGTDV